MRIRLTIAAVLAVFAISAPLASAESTGVPGAVEGTVTITHTTGSLESPDPEIVVSMNACLELEPDGDASNCEGEDIFPPVELDPGPPKELNPGSPEGTGPSCRDGREAVLCG